jgi:ribosomal protein S6E (S10)
MRQLAITIAWIEHRLTDIPQIVRITGGNDKQGFPMKQGVVCPARISTYHSPY